MLSACGPRQTPSEISQNVALRVAGVDRYLPPVVEFCEKFVQTGAGDVTEFDKLGFSKPPVGNRIRYIDLGGQAPAGIYGNFKNYRMQVSTSYSLRYGRACDLVFSPSIGNDDPVVIEVLEQLRRSGYSTPIIDSWKLDLQKPGSPGLTMKKIHDGANNTLTVVLEKG